MKRAMRNLVRVGIALALVLGQFAVLGGLAPVSAAVSAVDMTSKDSGTTETELGNLLADAIRTQVKADIGFVTASEIKEVTLPKGNVSAADVSRAIVFQNDPVVTLLLRGEQIKRALERSVAIYPQKNLGFLQVSGLKFTFDPGKPKESRVASVSVNGVPLDPAKNYTVGVTNSLASGAVGYFRVWEKDQITSVTKISVSQAVENYLQANENLNYKRDRITVTK
jgi:5'-nucleotidase / UDP-sugar diphosphatase